MRLLTTLVAGAAVVYGGYWFIGQSSVEKASLDAIETYRSEGWTIDYASLETTGFPSRFDTTFSDFHIQSPDGRFGWSAPIFQILALSYSPHKVIAAWPERQNLVVNGIPVTVDSTGMRASAKFGIETTIPLETATLESGAISWSGDFGTITADHLLAALRPSGAVSSYDVWLDAKQLTVPSPNGSEILPLAKIDATLNLSDDIKLRDDVLPRLNGLTLREARVDWEDISFSLSGELVVDNAGYPEGKIIVSTRNMPLVIDKLEDLGVIATDVASTYQNIARSMQSGDGTVELPLSLRSGMLAFGPFPLAALPKLR